MACNGYERWERKTLAKGRAEGKAEGEAKAVLKILDARGLRVTAAQRKQVLGCTDAAQLDAWLRAVATTPSVKVLLSGVGPARSRDRQS